MNTFKKMGLSLLGLSVCFGVYAGEHKHDHAHKHEHEGKHAHEEHHAHEAGEYKHHAHTHEHGVAKVNMAVDQQNVTFEVILAGNDVLGFEHTPKTEKEQQTYAQVKSRLAQSETLFSLPSAAKCSVQAQTGENIKFDADQGELMATYTYQCQLPEKMKTVTVDLFKLYPAIEKVVFQGISKHAQNAAELTLKNPIFQWQS